MPEVVMTDLLSLTGRIAFRLIDITGGTPEIHSRFRFFLEALSSQGHHLQVRTNLMTLLVPCIAEIIPLLRARRVFPALRRRPDG
ncbi:MAG: hypothetical protein ACYC5X_09955 [Syntrophales bacterium]